MNNSISTCYVVGTTVVKLNFRMFFYLKTDILASALRIVRIDDADVPIYSILQPDCHGLVKVDKKKVYFRQFSFQRVFLICLNK